MIAIAHFAGLVLTTIFAAAAAVLLDWLLLRAMFQLMRPATAKAASFEKVGPLQKAGPTKAFRDEGTSRSLGFARDETTAPTVARSFGSELVNGTRELARQFGPAALRR